MIIGGILTIGTELDNYSLCCYVLNSRSLALTGSEFGIESSVIGMTAFGLGCLVSIWKADK